VLNTGIILSVTWFELYWCQTGWSECFRNCWMIYWDFHSQSFLGFTDNGLKQCRVNIQWSVGKNAAGVMVRGFFSCHTLCQLSMI